MFNVTLNDINAILRDYCFRSPATSFSELQRYHYEKKDPDSKEVRLIIKVELCADKPVVIRFKNESDVTLELMEEQSKFAVILRQNGIEVPKQYKTEDGYARWYSIDTYEVIVTVEQFVEGELHCVDVETALETGRLLAKMHNIAERLDVHIENDVLFNPFSENDLFAFSAFRDNSHVLSDVDAPLYADIVKTYEEYMKRLLPLNKEPKYAVQGDISDCNLYRTCQGGIGVFDFNRAGDNNLYCDAVMQAVFEARLMDYPDSCAGRSEELILPAFLKGYHMERPFTEIQKESYPYLYAIIHAFWSQDIKWNDNSLLHAIEKGQVEDVRRWLKEIHRRIHHIQPIAL